MRKLFKLPMISCLLLAANASFAQPPSEAGATINYQVYNSSAEILFGVFMRKAGYSPEDGTIVGIIRTTTSFGSLLSKQVDAVMLYQRVGASS